MAKKKQLKKGKGKKDMITLNLDSSHGHDCKEVHPDESHKEWEEGEDEHDKNSASEGPHGEAMGAAEYRKKGIYVTDANHPGKGEKGKKDDDDDDDDSNDDGKGKPPWLKKEASHAIVNFVKNVNEKNYAEANKYLQVALEEKMKDRISSIAKKIGF